MHLQVLSSLDKIELLCLGRFVSKGLKMASLLRSHTKVG